MLKLGSEVGTDFQLGRKPKLLKRRKIYTEGERYKNSPGPSM